jgi:hypothetical protein
MKKIFFRTALAAVLMMQHEFGHILQYREVGAGVYWNLIAPASLASATFNSGSHSNFWTETWANYMSKNYFGNAWIGGSAYPAVKLSLSKYLVVMSLRNYCLMQSVGI